MFDEKILGAAWRMPEMVVPPNPLVQATEANYASEFYKQLTEFIHKFAAGLDEAHEVAVRLVSFGQTVVFHLEDIGCSDPSLNRFTALWMMAAQWN